MNVVTYNPFEACTEAEQPKTLQILQNFFVFHTYLFKAVCKQSKKKKKEKAGTY